MKRAKKFMGLLLAGVMMVSMFAGCGSSAKSTEGSNQAASGTESTAAGTSAAVETKHHKIGVALYTDSGKAVDAIKAFLSGISKTVDCEFTYTTLSTYDEATNLSAIQNLISSGCEGIIMTADMGTESIIKECQSANVYLAGFLCDYNTSYTTAFDAVFKNPNFLGTVADGKVDGSDYGVAVAKQIIEKGYKDIGVLTFPAYAYPNQKLIDTAFRDTIKTYNDTAADADKIKIEDTVELNFAPLEATYLSDHPDMDALFSIAAGAGMVYPTLVSNNKTNIKLYTTGFEGTDDVTNFGTAGNQCYQGTVFSTPEAIIYPLCLLIDKLNGTTYSDLPATAERVDCSAMVVLSDEDMKTVTEHSLYYTAKYENAFVTGEDVVKLCASYNKDATYANLVAAINKMSVADLK